MLAEISIVAIFIIIVLLVLWIRDIYIKHDIEKQYNDLLTDVDSEKTNSTSKDESQKSRIDNINKTLSEIENNLVTKDALKNKVDTQTLNVLNNASFGMVLGNDIEVFNMLNLPQPVIQENFAPAPAVAPKGYKLSSTGATIDAIDSNKITSQNAVFNSLETNAGKFTSLTGDKLIANDATMKNISAPSASFLGGSLTNMDISNSRILNSTFQNASANTLTSTDINTDNMYIKTKMTAPEADISTLRTANGSFDTLTSTAMRSTSICSGDTCMISNSVSGRNPLVFDVPVTVNKGLCMGTTCIDDTTFRNLVSMVAPASAPPATATI